MASETVKNEFNEEQIDRLDEIDNAAYNFAKVIAKMPKDTEKDEREEWMACIGEITDAAVEIMLAYGREEVWYPYIEEDENGNETTFDFERRVKEDEV